MKAKKLLPILALALAATTFAACGDKAVTFGHYWFLDPSAKDKAFYECAEYTVTSEAFKNSYANYAVEYSGTFTTTFEYNQLEGHYTFATKLDVDVTFTLGETEKKYEDSAESFVKFDAKDNKLRPIESSKKILCHTPISGKFDAVEKCFAVIDYEYTTKYDTDKGNVVSGECKITNNKGETKESTISKTFGYVKDLTFIDNEQILVAVRAFSEDATSATLGSYSVFASNTQKIKLSFADEEDKASEAFAYTLVDANGTETQKQLKELCRTASINLEQTNPGVTQKIKFVKAKDATNNTYRNLILEMTTPLSYGMGEIYYKLNKVSYQKP